MWCVLSDVLEQTECLLVLAMESRFLPLDPAVSRGLGVIEHLQGVGEAAGLVDGFEAFFDEFFCLVELQIKCGGLDVTGADEPPFAVCHAFDETSLDVVIGLELGDKGADITVVILTVFVEENGGLRINPMLDGVSGRTEFSVGGCGSGGAERVAAIGFELYF